eukprot:NODE_3742_length_736_cov_84.157205_g3146_i0.p1 GENE.NODE_3742_length_736_cov_84.157205_g3146_i0~~NODE_3742_length_736_cov_84.157205_g3146_i0.p1  ORF type:complete len:119 (-),score=35.61 NODE_3742_length_736_cov_84.157205_g3146_i0:83-439(-)
MRYRAGHQTVRIVVMGELSFTIRFKDMQQVNAIGQYRQVRRMAARPRWCYFDTKAGRWSDFPSREEARMEARFVQAEQWAQVQGPDNGMAMVDLRRMGGRQVSTSDFFAVSRQMHGCL